MSSQQGAGRVMNVLIPALRGLLHAALHSPICHAVRIHVLIGDSHVVICGQVVSDALGMANRTVLVTH